MASTTLNSPASLSASLAPLSTTVSEPDPVRGFGVMVNVAPPSRLAPSGPFLTQLIEPRALVKLKVIDPLLASVFVSHCAARM